MNLNLSKVNMSKSLGIDLGTSNTLIYLAGKGIVLQEPSVAAINSRSMQVLEVGDAAGLMVGKTGGEQLAFRPIKDGVIADFDVTVDMLGKFIRKVTGPIFLNRPKVAVCVSCWVCCACSRCVMPDCSVWKPAIVSCCA